MQVFFSASGPISHLPKPPPEGNRTPKLPGFRLQNFTFWTPSPLLIWESHRTGTVRIPHATYGAPPSDPEARWRRCAPVPSNSNCKSHQHSTPRRSNGPMHPPLSCAPLLSKITRARRDPRTQALFAAPSPTTKTTPPLLKLRRLWFQALASASHHRPSAAAALAAAASAPRRAASAAEWTAAAACPCHLGPPASEAARHASAI